MIGQPSRPATPRQLDVLAAYVAAGGSVSDAADLVGIRPSTAKRHLADLRARSGLTTEQLIYEDALPAGWSSRVWSPADRNPPSHKQTRPVDLGCDALNPSRIARMRSSALVAG